MLSVDFTHQHCGADEYGKLEGGGNLKEWVMSACFVIAATGMYSFLCPDKRYEKLLNLVISAVFLLCLLSPVVKMVGGDFSLNLSDIGTADPGDTLGLEQQKQEQLIYEVTAKTQVMVSEKLAASGINAVQVRIDIGIEEETLVVQHCTVVLAEQDAGQSGPVTDIIRSELLITPDIKVVAS